MRTNNETPKGVFLFPRKSVGPGAKLVRQNGCIVMYQIANQIQKSVTGEQFLWNLPNKLFPVPSVPEKKLSYLAKKNIKNSWLYLFLCIFDIPKQLKTIQV